MNTHVMKLLSKNTLLYSFDPYSFNKSIKNKRLTEHKALLFYFILNLEKNPNYMYFVITVSVGKRENRVSSLTP